MVSQNKSYREERALGLLFAPTKTQRGTDPMYHWATMADLDSSDIIFCAYNQRIVSVAAPVGPSIIDTRPAELPESEWANEGWISYVEYFDLLEPINIYVEVDHELRVGESRFTQTGIMTQQYLVPLSDHFAAVLLADFKDRLPDALVPARPQPRLRKELPSGTRDTPLEATTATVALRTNSQSAVVAALTHGQLVNDYVAHIERKRGHRLGSRSFEGPSAGVPLRADVVYPQQHAIIEAKPTPTTDELYRALGQLSIYRELDGRGFDVAVLFNQRPSGWHLARLKAAGVGCIWREGETFIDTAKGRFV